MDNWQYCSHRHLLVGNHLSDTSVPQTWYRHTIGCKLTKNLSKQQYDCSDYKQALPIFFPVLWRFSCLGPVTSLKSWSYSLHSDLSYFFFPRPILHFSLEKSINLHLSQVCSPWIVHLAQKKILHWYLTNTNAIQYHQRYSIRGMLYTRHVHHEASCIQRFY